MPKKKNEYCSQNRNGFGVKENALKLEQDNQLCYSTREAEACLMPRKCLDLLQG
jgi:hypothetical protein